jgi:hypothetical protein
MLGSRRDRDGNSVMCIACGQTLPRSDAREYDKEGDRWSRHGKEFEYLCKECHSDLCHQPRDELESLLVDVEDATGEDSLSSEEFVSEYQREVVARYGELEDADADADTDRDRRR